VSVGRRDGEDQRKFFAVSQLLKKGILARFNILIYCLAMTSQRHLKKQFKWLVKFRKRGFRVAVEKDFLGWSVDVYAEHPTLKQAFLVEIGNIQNRNKKKELENYCNRMRGKTEWRYYFIHEKYGEDLSKQVFEIIDTPKSQNFLEMLEEEIKLRVVINQLNL